MVNTRAAAGGLFSNVCTIFPGGEILGENPGTFCLANRQENLGGSEFYHKHRHQLQQNICSKNPGAFGNKTHQIFQQNSVVLRKSRSNHEKEHI